MNPQQQHCRCKNFFASERAVSTTLAFVIITGILISTFAILMAVQVPQWTKETEAEHAAKVPLEFAELDSVIDMAILRGGTSSSGCRLEMMPESVPAVGVHASAGMLEFNNSAERFRFKACAPGEVPPVGSTPGWNSTPVNFSDANYTKCHVVTPDRGAELALEIGEDMIFDSRGEEYLAGEFWFNNFAVINGTTLFASQLAIHAMNITIGPNSSIIADDSGLAGGKYNNCYQGQDQGKGPGKGGITTNFSAGGGGAGYGGRGGKGGNSTYGDGGEGGYTYGKKDEISIDDIGSGGGCGRGGDTVSGVGVYTGGGAGAGGGTAYLDAPIIIIAGNVSANGGDGRDGEYRGDKTAWDSAAGGGGGGSGGVIMLKGDNVSISGNLYSKGGNGGNGGIAVKKDYQHPNNGGGGGGGGGGRIKILYDSNLTVLGGINNLTNHTNVDGGAGGLGGVGGDGTPGGNGAAGEEGTAFNHSIYYPHPVHYYDMGYINSIVWNTTTPLVCYGNMTWDETVAEDTNIIMKVRTSIDENMCYGMDWGDCPPVVNGTDISDLPSVSDGNQYIQWRAEFMTFDLAKTPILHWVNISYEYGVPFIVNTSGNISYSSQYTDLRNFELVYAQGATIKKQTEGELMVSDPSISISNKGNCTELIITAINLTGSNKTLSGGFRATIKPYDTNSELITGGLYFTDFTINITTDYPAVWKKWFNDTCEDAGLDFGTNPGNYIITGNGTHAKPLSIAFYGNETIPVKIWLKSAEAKIEMRAEG